MRLATTQSIKEAKLVMLGSTTAGKSSIVTRLTKETFNPDAASTVGAAFVSKSLPENDPKVKLQIWDTGGSERYRAMAPMYFRDADAAIIVFDVTSDKSFEEVQRWLSDLKEGGPPHVIIAMAGNKCDLVNQRVVSQSVAEEFARENSISIFKQTSALTGENVQALFQEIAERIAASGIKSTIREEGMKLKDPRSETAKSGCCK